MRYAEYSSTLNYNEFKGLFISEANSVSFEYEPLGSVNSVVESGYRKRKYIRATAEDALYVLCKEAEKNGANGIINLKITYTWGHDKNGAITRLINVAASGMAIIRD
jgi:uncharacterized protein YbjQ (UPF0145 family)